VRSAHAPQRLAVELQSRLGPSLAQRGYRLVGHGTSGLTWRREMSGKLIAGLVVLGLLALGGIASGEVGSILFGLACAASAGVVFYARRPAVVSVDLTRIPNGTEIDVHGGPDVARSSTIVRAVAGPEPTGHARPERPDALWSGPQR
jgi:hypothetical protein